MPTLKKVPAYQDGDGVLHTTIDGWQHAELRKLATGSEWAKSTTPEEISGFIMANAQPILEVLTTGPTSRPSTRKRAGTTSPKRAAKRATEAQATAGFKAMRQAATPAEKAHVEDVTGMPYKRGGTNATHDADVPAEPAAA